MNLLLFYWGGGIYPNQLVNEVPKPSKLKKILIMDDKSDILNLLSHRLTSHNYEVFSAVNGQEGLILASKTKPDLLIVDLMMPMMEGYNLIRYIKKDSNLTNIPIFILTGKTQLDEQIVTQTNIEAFIPKPFDSEQLLKKVTTFLTY